MTFAERLQELLTARSMRPIELAAAVRVSEETVKHWLAGVNLPRPETLAAIADLFSAPERHITIDKLMGREPAIRTG